MATCNWLSRAAARAQVSTIQVTAYHVGTTYTLTCNGKSVSTIAAGSVNATATALALAWNNSTITEMTEVTALAATDTITFSGDTAGATFTITKSVSGGTGTLGSVTEVTAATGPNNWNDANNWDGGAVPITGDDVNADLSLGSIKTGLDQSAVTLATLYIFSSVANQQTIIGLPKQNVSGYTEYRDDYLKISATAHRIDTDSTQIKINFGSVATAGEVRRTGQSQNGIPSVLLKGTNVSNAFEAVEGSLGLGFYDNESVAGATLKVDARATGYVGPSASIAAVTNCGQQLDFRGTCATAMTCNGGQVIRRGTTSTTTLTAEGGTIDDRSSGGATNVVLGGRAAGVLNCENDLSARTYGTVTYKKGGELFDPNNVATQTAIVRDTSVQRMVAA